MNKTQKLQGAKDYAISRGGICLSEEYVDSKTKMEWKCLHTDHPSWLAPTENVMGKKTWCMLCSGKAKKSSEVGLKEAQAYAKSKGGICLSNEYLGNAKNLEWKCSNAEHPSWLGPTDNVIRQKTWCQYCANKLNRAKALIK